MYYIQCGVYGFDLSCEAPSTDIPAGFGTWRIRI